MSIFLSFLEILHAGFSVFSLDMSFGENFNDVMGEAVGVVTTVAPSSSASATATVVVHGGLTPVQVALIAVFSLAAFIAAVAMLCCCWCSW